MEAILFVWRPVLTHYSGVKLAWGVKMASSDRDTAYSEPGFLRDLLFCFIGTFYTEAMSALGFFYFLVHLNFLLKAMSIWDRGQSLGGFLLQSS